jgi:FKBP-type peptidyl-prolyl cis-trans isomerase
MAKARLLGAVDRALQKKTAQINRAQKITDAIKMDHEPLPVNRMNANKTGLKDRLDALKQRAAAARAKAAKASEKVSAAFDRQEQASAGLETYAAHIEKEADEVLAELSQFGDNGGPA